jgi:hypothetical protein
LDANHLSKTTAGTSGYLSFQRGQDFGALRGSGQELGGGRGEQLAAESEIGGAVAIGEEAAMADAGKSVWESV